MVTAEPAQHAAVAHGVDRFAETFWLGRVRTTAAERTWAWSDTDHRRLPRSVLRGTDLLGTVARIAKAGSRSRLEVCKAFKRLDKLACLHGLEQPDPWRAPYEPALRELPTDEGL